MKEKLFFFAILLLINYNLSSKVFGIDYPKNKYEHAGNWDLPVVFIRDSWQKIGDYQTSLQNWLNVLKVSQSPEGYYQVAVNYAKLNNQDSAFYYLCQYVNVSKDDRLIFVDKAFDSLRYEKENWEELSSKIEELFLQGTTPSINKELALKLFYLNISKDKYEYYAELLDFPDSYFDTLRHEKFGSFRMLKRQILGTKDSLNKLQNENEYKNLLKEYGFPTIAKVGKFGEQIAYSIMNRIVISNDDYHLIKTAYNQNKYDPIAYAIITDKWLIQNRKKQYYGTQMSLVPFGKNKNRKAALVLCPTKDFNKINDRRNKMGFSETIEEYVQRKNCIIPQKYY